MNRRQGYSPKHRELWTAIALSRRGASLRRDTSRGTINTQLRPVADIGTHVAYNYSSCLIHL